MLGAVSFEGARYTLGIQTVEVIRQGFPVTLDRLKSNTQSGHVCCVLLVALDKEETVFYWLCGLLLVTCPLKSQGGQFPDVFSF